MPVLQKNALTHIKEYALITVGILLFVVGWSLFLLPNNLIRNWSRVKMWS